MASESFYLELLPAILFASAGVVTVLAYLLGLRDRSGAKGRAVAAKPAVAAPRRAETPLAPVVSLRSVAPANAENDVRPTIAAGAIVTSADVGDAFDDEPTRIVEGPRRVRARTA